MASKLKLSLQGGFDASATMTSRSLAVRVYCSKFPLKDSPLILFFWPTRDGLVRACTIKKSMSEPMTWAPNWAHASKIDPVLSKIEIIKFVFKIVNYNYREVLWWQSQFWPTRDGLVRACTIKKLMSEPITWAPNWANASKIENCHHEISL